MVQERVLQKDHQKVESSLIVAMVLLLDQLTPALVPGKILPTVNGLLEARFGSTLVGEDLLHGCGSWCEEGTSPYLASGCGSCGDQGNLQGMRLTQEIPDLMFDWLKVGRRAWLAEVLPGPR